MLWALLAACGVLTVLATFAQLLIVLKLAEGYICYGWRLKPANLRYAALRPAILKPAMSVSRMADCSVRGY